ncbi:MAG: hypothetical protein ACE5KM_01930 [Planctomycetaceae bacterium]
MQRIKLLALTSVLAVVLAAPLSLQAGPSGVSDDSIEDIADVYYDWEVWVSEPVTVYLVKVKTLKGPNQTRSFDTLEEAVEYAAYMELHSNVYDTDIVEDTVLGPWEYFDTFDKRADAEALAAKAASFGLYTKIVRIDVFGSTVP